MNGKTVVTRFAPSPTGYLHIGGARTALFSWAYARRHQGRFILRVEDTDQARSSPEATRRLLADLNWLQLHWDEGPNPEVADHAAISGDDPYGRQIGPNGPYFQSQRLETYNRYLDQLLRTGQAYEDYRSAEEIEEGRRLARAEGRTWTAKSDRLATMERSEEQRAKFKAEGRQPIVRFLAPDRDVSFTDAVLGEVTAKADELDDIVIRKADGYPTFHFAVVVDDALMGVTHVIRGQDHLNNTPKHVALQQALGFETPTYAHIPLIFNPDGSKMGKRDKAKAARAAAAEAGDLDAGTLGLGEEAFARFMQRESDDPAAAAAIARQLGIDLPEVDVHDFRVSGYLPEVLVNYLSLLGWWPPKEAGENLEQFGPDPWGFLTEWFALERVQKGAAKFDREKLFRFNADAIAALPFDEFVERLRAHAEAFAPAFTQKLDAERFRRFAAMYQERARTLAEPFELGAFFIVGDDAIAYDAQAVAKHLAKGEGAGYGVLERLKGVLGAVEPWDAEPIEQAVRQFAEREGLGLGKVAQPLRIAVTGTTVSPSIFDTLALLGKNATLGRIDRCLAQRTG
jgi:glutamyl-tRNA synthetase